jgi:Na+/pantothenate symporter
MKIEQLTWIPRIMAMIFIIFLLQFSFSIFTSPILFWLKVKGFFIYSFPALMFLITLIYSWKYPKIGGIIFMVLGVIFTAFFHTYSIITSFFIITLPALLIGGLFIYYSIKTRPIK